MEGLIPSDLFLFIGSSRRLFFLVSNILKVPSLLKKPHSKSKKRRWGAASRDTFIN